VCGSLPEAIVQNAVNSAAPAATAARRVGQMQEVAARAGDGRQQVAAAAGPASAPAPPPG